MPQLLFLAALGAGAYMGVKWFKRKAGQIHEEMEKAMDKQKGRRRTSMKDMPKLKPDPKTGVYRVEND